MNTGKAGRFLSLPSAARRSGGGHDTKTSAKLFRHPGYSLLDWKKFCESMPIYKQAPLQVNVDDLSLHSTEDDCWIAVRGKVYNVTSFLKFHPGRKAQLLRGAGVDCTELYDKVHSWVNEEAILKQCFIGYLVPGEGPIFHNFIVSAIEAVSHNTKLFVLAKPPGIELCVAAGQYVRMRALIKGENVIREYTPIVNIMDPRPVSNDCLMLMIKIYPRGKMTQHLSTVKTGMV
jgi:cytochrome-b5 reductase